MKNDRPGPDPVIVAALRRLGDQHEPDSDAIWARVDPARSGVEAPVRPSGRRDRVPRSIPTRPSAAPMGRPRFAGALAISLAAASVLGVFGLTQAITRPPEAGAPVATTLPTNDGAPTTDPDGTPAQVLGDAASTSPAEPPTGQNRSQSPPSGGDAAQSTPPPAGTVAPTTAGNQAAGLPSLLTSKIPLRKEFTLDTDRYQDWVAIGARNDRNQVRAKRPVGGPALTVEAPPGATVATSPLLVSWTDGYTEQTRLRSSLWLQGTPGGAWTIKVERGNVPRKLVVLAGGAAAGYRIDTSSPGGPSGRWTATNPSGSGPFAVILDIPGGSGPLTVTLTAAQDALSVAAVTLQRN